MNYESELAETQGAITRLRNELRQTRLPARTINWQHNNLGQTRGITQRVLITKKKIAKINSNIKYNERKAMSLRESILGGMK